ncbi:MAG: hypothetical protein ACR2QJ_02125 [Geminicoccaceae bacterium]
MQSMLQVISIGFFLLAVSVDSAKSQAGNCSDTYAGTTQSCCFKRDEDQENYLFSDSWKELRCGLLDRSFLCSPCSAHEGLTGPKWEQNHRKTFTAFDGSKVAFLASIPCGDDTDEIFFNRDGHVRMWLRSRQLGLRPINVNVDRIDIDWFEEEWSRFRAQCEPSDNAVIVVHGQAKEYHRYIRYRGLNSIPTNYISYDIEVTDIAFTGQFNRLFNRALFVAENVPAGRFVTLAQVMAKAAKHENACYFVPRWPRFWESLGASWCPMD